MGTQRWGPGSRAGARGILLSQGDKGDVTPRSLLRTLGSERSGDRLEPKATRLQRQPLCSTCQHCGRSAEGGCWWGPAHGQHGLGLCR